MPMHDWTRVRAGTYHNFHYRWIAAIMDRLNAGLLPSGYFAMAEQIVGGPEPDVVALQTDRRNGGPPESNGGVALAPVETKTRFVLSVTPEQERYARKTNQVVIRHELGDVVAVIELVSPGNKDRRKALYQFVDKTVELLQQRVSLLVIDPFPPGTHDPEGMHAAIWSELSDESFELPEDKPLAMAAFQAVPVKTAYIEAIAVGDPLPDMPLFLHEDRGIELPLEETYQTTWDVLPEALRALLDPADTDH